MPAVRSPAARFLPVNEIALIIATDEAAVEAAIQTPRWNEVNLGALKLMLR